MQQQEQEQEQKLELILNLTLFLLLLMSAQKISERAMLQPVAPHPSAIHAKSRSSRPPRTVAALREAAWGSRWVTVIVRRV